MVLAADGAWATTSSCCSAPAGVCFGAYLWDTFGVSIKFTWEGP